MNDTGNNFCVWHLYVVMDSSMTAINTQQSPTSNYITHATCNAASKHHKHIQILFSKSFL